MPSPLWFLLTLLVLNGCASQNFSFPSDTIDIDTQESMLDCLSIFKGDGQTITAWRICGAN